MELERIATDSSKHVFPLLGVDERECVVLRRNLRRKQLAVPNVQVPTEMAIGRSDVWNRPLVPASVVGRPVVWSARADPIWASGQVAAQRAGQMNAADLQSISFAAHLNARSRPPMVSDTPNRDISPYLRDITVLSDANAHPLVVTVVLNWRRPDETAACVRSLLATDYPNHRILVIDNSAGTTNIEQWLAGLPTEIVRNPENLGFAGGVNVGLRWALDEGADYVWLMNSDATAAPGALRALVATAEANPRIGLLSPVIHAPANPDEIVFCLGLHKPNHVAGDSTRDPTEAALWLRERPGQCVLYGAALLVRRALAEAIGGLDERFFAYSEDVDYCMRCHDAGFEIALCFEAVAYHHFKDLNAADIPLYVHYFMNRNQLLLWRQRNRFGLFSRAFVWYLYQRLLKVEREKSDAVAVNGLLLGLWDGMRGVGGPYNPNRSAPWWLRRTIGRHPGIVLNLLEGRAPWRGRIR